MHRSAPVDDYEPLWGSFAEFFTSRRDLGSPFLIELGADRAERRTWTVAEWRRDVEQVAAELQGALPANSAVAALLGNRAEALLLAYACWVAGHCYVPLNPRDSDERQAFIVDDCRAAVLFTDGRRTTVPKRAGVPAVVLGDRPLSSAMTAPAGMATTASHDLDTRALRVYTSGTTGSPKGVELTVRNLLVDSDALAERTGWDSTTRILTVLPVHHVNGLIISSLLPWYTSSSTVLVDRFRSEQFWLDAAAERATVASLVPSLLEFLLAADGEPPAGFTEVLCGAGPLLTETVMAFEERFEIAVRHLFGMSETTAVVTMMPRLDAAERRAWYTTFEFPSIGPAVDHAEVAVVSPEGSPVPAGVRGELVVRGAMVMDRYTGHDADRQPDAWLSTGDEGFWQPSTSEAPYFFVTGRTKEIIIRGGVNITPIEIDAVLSAHPAVSFALTVPFPNRFYGEEVAAYVVTASPTLEADLLDHCAQHLDYSKCPKVVVFGSEIPFTATGKPKRIELAQQLEPLLERFRNSQFRRSSSTSDRDTNHPPRQLRGATL